MPGLVKLGYTDRSPSERARELSSSTGVPEEFTVYAWWEILNTGAIELEKKIHQKFKNDRYRNNREFFVLEPEYAIAEIEVLVKSLDWSEENADFYYECTAELLSKHRQNIEQERLKRDLENKKNEDNYKQRIIESWNNQDANLLLTDLKSMLSKGKLTNTLINTAKFTAFSTITLGLGSLLLPAYLKQNKKDHMPQRWDAFRKYQTLRAEYFLNKGFTSVPDAAIDHTKNGVNPFL